MRLAVGASPSSAARSIVREALLICLLGIALGLPLAALAARSLRSLMFGVSENDPATYLFAAAVFMAVGLIAAFSPARRAAGVDPVIALRAE